MRKIIFTFCFLLSFSSFSQGLMVNEVSNGPTGSQEYMELVVVGPNNDGSGHCGDVDLRGWIIDDNNGDFSSVVVGSGIASGHIRLSNNSNWSAVPTGSIILVYNDDSANLNPLIPAADPTDANLDHVYIVPASSTQVERCTTLPSTASSLYGPCTYTAGLPTPNWPNQLGLANTGDAAQVRTPTGTYAHGFGYGSNVNGGPDGLYFSGTGAGQVFNFLNSTNSNFRSISNFLKSPVAGNETPGAGNAVANTAWINSLRPPCTLPVVFSQELSAWQVSSQVKLKWKTSSEIGLDFFEIQRSEDATNFSSVGKVWAQRSAPSSYSWLDEPTQPGDYYYRLKIVEIDGTSYYSPVAQLLFEKNVGLKVFPNPVKDDVIFSLRESDLLKILLFDLSGKLVLQTELLSGQSISMISLESGIYSYQVESAGKWYTGSLIKTSN